MTLIVKIEQVDRYGYLGREHHPTRDMEGHTARITRVETWTDDEELDPTRLVGPWGRHSRPASDDAFCVFYGITDDGRPVELIEHEISLVRFALSDQQLDREATGPRRRISFRRVAHSQ